MLLGYKNFLNKEYILVVIFIAIDKRQTQRIYFRGMNEIGILTSFILRSWSQKMSIIGLHFS
ncbi:hypothetical protein F2421_20595 [Salmonella enterica subsp. enterica serovar Kiambu]|nr:hypothetical protein [Salmonella enterica subsp. enterica serovar Kiambu]